MRQSSPRLTDVKSERNGDYCGDVSALQSGDPYPVLLKCSGLLIENG
jgi:hypothetical protein